jgi:hypothetical protein
MAKIRSTITGGASGDFHSKAYAAVHHRDICSGSTRDGTHVPVPVNSHTLDSMVEQDSLRTTNVYDYQTGTFSQRKLDIVENARANINRLKIHPVTNGRHEESEKMPTWGVMATPAPAAGRNRRKRGK